ncbi:hypothetical protein ACJRO7_016999 [Eucalyptus globulus]|uniref:Uncharacterized protein n=1 Tax=Eucalyptus globulus TaxID=34317 RepID=A0ABD3KNV8_EUCGL
MMDRKVDRRFGSGPKELCGAVDLISRFRLQPYHEFFCKKPLPVSVSDTNYLKSVVGDREIRKGERLNSDQLSLTPPHVKKGGSQIHAFDMKVLWEAFEIRQAPSLCLFPGVERANTAVAKYGHKGKRKHKSHKMKRKDNKRSKHHHHHDKKDGIKK